MTSSNGYILVPDVSLPMDATEGNVMKGSMRGTMTAGVFLVAARVGNGLYSDGGHVNYGTHDTECFQNPDMCGKGITFAMWLKRTNGAGAGSVLSTGGTYKRSRGKKNETYQYVNSSPPWAKMAAIWQTMCLDEFSWIKCFVFWLKFHWNVLPRVWLALIQHWFR